MQRSEYVSFFMFYTKHFSLMMTFQRSKHPALNDILVSFTVKIYIIIIWQHKGMSNLKQVPFTFTKYRYLYVQDSLVFLRKLHIGENGHIMLNTELLKYYQSTPFFKLTKRTALINTNIKGLSTTCFGTSVSSSGTTKFQSLKTNCHLAASLLTLFKYKRYNCTPVQYHTCSNTRHVTNTGTAATLG